MNARYLLHPLLITLTVSMAYGQGIPGVMDQPPVSLYKTPVSAIALLALDPEGQRLLTEEYDGTVVLWDLAKRCKIRAFRGQSKHISVLKFSSDGKYVVSGWWDGTVLVWSAETGKQIHLFRVLEKSLGLSVDDVALHSKTSRLATTACAGPVIVWDTTTGRKTHTLFWGNYLLLEVAFSSDGKYILAGSGEAAICWEASTGRRVWRFTKPGAWALDPVAFTPDGRGVFTAATEDPEDDCQYGLWVGETGKRLYTLQHNESGAPIALSRDGKRLVTTGFESGKLFLWDAKTGKELKVYQTKAKMFETVAISSDGGLVAAPVPKGALLWDTSSGKTKLIAVEKKKGH